MELILKLFTDGWSLDAIRNGLHTYADETQCGVSRVSAFRLAFPNVDPFQFISDGHLAQYYNGDDRKYDLD